MKKSIFTVIALVALSATTFAMETKKESSKKEDESVEETCCTATLKLYGVEVDHVTICGGDPMSQCFRAQKILLDRNPEAKKALQNSTTLQQ